MKEMVGGCCVCSDERGWSENPLVYCDGQGCTVAVHQACYGIVTVPTGPWYCRKCESQERAARVRCDLCPSRDGALKRTDSSGWAHVVCALYIPEVRFGNVTTMEPIILQLIPPERFNKVCYICQEMNKGGRASVGACMQCNKSGCKQQFHVTCAQALGLLCEEAGNYLDNVKYCGYCQHHYSKLKKGGNVKTIPPYKPIPTEQNSSDSSPEKEPEPILTPMVGIPVVTLPPKQPTPVPKSEPQPTKSSGRKSSSGSKSVSSSASSSSSSSSSVSAGLKNLTVSLTKDKHISKSSKGTTQTKSYDKDKSSRSQKSSTPTSSSTSSNNKSQKESSQLTDAGGRKTPVLENAKVTEKNTSKKDSKDHNNQKFSNTNYTDSVGAPPDLMVGDTKDYTPGSKTSVMKKRKVESRTSTPVPMQENHLNDMNHQLSQNVIVNLSDAKEAVEEKHKKAKTEESPPSSPSETLHSMSAGSHSSNMQHVTSTSQGVSKTDNISPVPQVVAPALSGNPNSSTTTLIVSVPLVNADPSLLNQGVYQPLVRNDPAVDRVINPPRSPPRVPEMDRQSPLVDQLVSGSATMSSMNAMHGQTSAVGRLNEQSTSQGISPSQNVVQMHHQIGGVPINQSVVHSSTSGSTLNTLSSMSSEMSGSVLKTGFEKQFKADEPIKRSRSHSSDKNVEKPRSNKRRSATNNSQLLFNNNFAVTQQQASLNIPSTSVTTQVNTHSITSTDSNTSHSTQSQSIAQSQQVQITTVNKRSSRSHPTPPPVASVPAMSVPKESPSSSPTPEEQPQKRKGRKPAVQSNTVSSPLDVKDVKLFQNGVHAPHMLGNQLNPNSNMAQKMSDHLNHELETHRVFSESVGSSMAIGTDENNPQGPLVGPPLLRNTGSTRAAAAPSSGIGNLLGGNVGAAGSNGGNGLGAAVPQSLDQLLERQWEQGSQFLMEQAQHFDIASLLSCLHQLRTENARLEDHVNTLVARRDHLLAVNARLAIPLTQPIPAGNAGGGVLRAAVNPSENGGQQEYRQVRASNQYVNVGGVPHGPIRGQGSVEGARANRGYQPYPVAPQNHQPNIRRDPDNRDTHHSQKPN